MSLLFIAIGYEAYQFAAHAHCLLGRTLPGSHRTTRGFGIAIVADALAYLLSCICLYGSTRAWMVFLVPLLAHVFYGCLLAFFRSFYMRIHDYRLATIYTDSAFRRTKQVASFLDTSLHLLALVMLARQVSAPQSLSLAVAGVVAYACVFAPAALGARVDARRQTQIVQKKHA